MPKHRRVSAESDAVHFGDAAEADRYLFAEGTHETLWRWLGAHPRAGGCVFRVWAPNAAAVSVVGDFNDWQKSRDPMHPLNDSGVWEATVTGARPGQRYKFALTTRSGERLPLKADPLARRMQCAPDTAGEICAPTPYRVNDEAWLARRGERIAPSAPISIYEVHSASWRRRDDGSPLSYRELGDALIPYVQDLGFTHIQFLPMSEYPFDGSWGYQPVGLFAPTSRHGDADGYRELVDRCHQAGIGVLQDWVPGHFPTDPHGLARFDGSALYEHEDPRMGFHRDWNTHIYNYGRHEIDAFLLSNARYWIEEFHIDGLRVDAVASMLYLDYSREPGEWVPNVHGGNENLEAIALLQRLNTRLYGEYPGIATIAEESTAWPGVSHPVHDGGLGFGYKWNMGWMHDTLRYMSRDPIHRPHHHHDLSFGISYAFSENFILPLSHDEVVHGKGSLLGRMPGDDWQRFANLRAYFAFMWTHPGKKLLFMGGEFAQDSEWNHDHALPWHLLRNEKHAGVCELIRNLNGLYREHPALHRFDCDPRGFTWIAADDAAQSVIAYLRNDGDGSHILVVCNFTPRPRTGYRIGAPRAGNYRLLLNSDAANYGGSAFPVRREFAASGEPFHGHAQSLELDLPPLATLILEVPGP